MTFEPVNGIEVEYNYRPSTPDHIRERREDCSPGEAATVDIKAVNSGGHDITEWLEDHGFDWEQLENEILRTHGEPEQS